MCPDGDKNNIDSQRGLYESLGRSDLLIIPSAGKFSIGEKKTLYSLKSCGFSSNTSIHAQLS